MKRSSFLWLAGCLLLAHNIFATEIDTCAVYSDSTTFFNQHLNRTLPVHNLNEILLLSVGTQSMHGADKTGMAYLIDGVDVSRLMYKNGASSDPYTVVNRNANPLGSPTGKWGKITSSFYINGRQAGMPNTVIQLAEREVAAADVHAGTIPATYGASGGVVNLTTRTGGERITASLNLRSSIGHLNHAGPDMYNNNPEHNPDYLDGKSVDQLYLNQRDQYSANEYWQSRAEAMTWYPGQYHYGDKPRINGDFTLGGSIGKKLKFFLAADVLNDYGTLPAQFQRTIGTSLKLNYQPNAKNNFTLYGKISDQGKIGGWVNRSFSYHYLFNPEFNPVHQGLGVMSYAKWQHLYNSGDNLELTISYVGDYHTWGYKLVEKEGELVLSAAEAGDDWLIIETAEDYKKYICDLDTRLFWTGPGGDLDNYVRGADNQIRFLEPSYYYENLKTEQFTANAVLSKTVNAHHKLSAGADYSWRHIARKTIASPYYWTYNADFKINPWEAGFFLQNQISYRGIQAMVGCRVDAYQTGTKVLTDIFAPGVSEKNLVYETKLGAVPDYSGKTEPVISISPRMAISHPVNRFSFMHYSWGLYTTPPDFTNLLHCYDFQNEHSWPHFVDQNMEPEKSMAWEMGMTVSPCQGAGLDVSAYYRDNRNSDIFSFVLRKPMENWFSLASYYVPWGYRDNLGLETTLWKQPSGQRLFGIVDLSGTLSMEYAYERNSQNGKYMATIGGIVQDDQWVQPWDSDLTVDERLSLEQTDYWPTYSRSNNTYWNLKAALRCDFPWQLELSHIFTFRSPWRYKQQLNVENKRYEKQLTGEYFLQWDLRAAKYFSYKRFGVKLYCDVLNVINRENILNVDNLYYSNYYEKGKGPWGYLGRSTDIYGNLYTGIAREIYLGIELILR